MHNMYFLAVQILEVILQTFQSAIALLSFLGFLRGIAGLRSAQHIFLPVNFRRGFWNWAYHRAKSFQGSPIPRQSRRVIFGKSIHDRAGVVPSNNLYGLRIAT